jgi:hypothetical protein
MSSGTPHRANPRATAEARQRSAVTTSGLLFAQAPKMLFRSLRIAYPIALLCLVACGSSDTGITGSPVSGPDCGAVEEIPAILTVVTSTGTPLDCDATITALDGPDAGPGNSSAPNIAPCDAYVTGCTASPEDGGAAAACGYTLAYGGSISASTYTVQISQPGFVTQVVPGVTSGVGGCVPQVPGSHITVTLKPVGGGDAG